MTIWNYDDGVGVVVVLFHSTVPVGICEETSETSTEQDTMADELTPCGWIYTLNGGPECRTCLEHVNISSHLCHFVMNLQTAFKILQNINSHT